MKEKEDLTVLFTKQLKQLIKEYNAKTGMVIENIYVDWFDIIGETGELKEIKLQMKTT